MSGCEAKVPFAPGLVFLCGREASVSHRYRCACGHPLTGATCPDHAPAPGQVGCYRCLKDGHDCPMEVAP